jgi:hypothetical protein
MDRENTMIRQITEQLKLPFQKAKKLTLKAICAIRGCRHNALYFSGNTLSFCTCCGEEIAGRTFDDIEPMDSDEWDEFQLHMDCCD